MYPAFLAILLVAEVRVGREKIGKMLQNKLLKTDSHIAYSAHAVPLPCRAAKGLECVFPI
jgi:hypothetical protein